MRLQKDSKILIQPHKAEKEDLEVESPKSKSFLIPHHKPTLKYANKKTSKQVPNKTESNQIWNNYKTTSKPIRINAPMPTKLKIYIDFSNWESYLEPGAQINLQFLTATSAPMTIRAQKRQLFRIPELLGVMEAISPILNHSPSHSIWTIFKNSMLIWPTKMEFVLGRPAAIINLNFVWNIVTFANVTGVCSIEKPKLILYPKVPTNKPLFCEKIIII